MKLGFIGCGNMARAIISGVLSSGYAEPDEIIASEPQDEARNRVKESFSIHVTDSNSYVLSQAQTVFLCVKPQVISRVLDDLSDSIEDSHLLVTIVAGKPLSFYQNAFGEDRHVRMVRLMPNTPALIGQGMTAACHNEYVTPGDLNEVLKIVRAFSEVEVVPESLFDTVTAVSGSSPAAVFMMIEAMADGAVEGGMPRAQALRFAAQAVMGSASLVLHSGRHPGELKDMVCSPAGTTIEVVHELEKDGFRASVMNAMNACRKRSSDMRS